MLSKRTKYGIKALTHLAKVDPLQPVLISEIAEKENISHKFLESILLTLKKSGFLVNPCPTLAVPTEDKLPE